MTLWTLCSRELPDSMEHCELSVNYMAFLKDKISPTQSHTHHTQQTLTKHTHLHLHTREKSHAYWDICIYTNKTVMHT